MFQSTTHKLISNSTNIGRLRRGKRGKRENESQMVRQREVTARAQVWNDDDDTNDLRRWHWTASTVTNTKKERV